MTVAPQHVSFKALIKRVYMWFIVELGMVSGWTMELE